jgi:hypothetical protein
MENIEFACSPEELSCIIGNLFANLEPPCKYVRSTHLMICGTTYSGNSGRLTVLGDRCSFYGVPADLENARKGPCLERRCQHGR